MVLGPQQPVDARGPRRRAILITTMAAAYERVACLTPRSSSASYPSLAFHFRQPGTALPFPGPPWKSIAAFGDTGRLKFAKTAAKEGDADDDARGQIPVDCNN
jgi:hypothetical protein